MSKRGRPSKNGYQPPWMLRRDTYALYGYQQARRAREKHESAIKEAIEFVRKMDAEMPMSETEVKRVLARWAPRQSPVSAYVSKPDPANNTIVLPDGKRVRVVFTVSVRPRTDYPRHNAADL